MVHVMHMHFMLFAVFKNLISSFSEDNMPEHTLDIFIENASKMVRVIPLNMKNEDQTFKIVPKLCIFLYNAMETTGVCHGVITMHWGVMDTVSHSGDAWDSMP